MGRLLPLLSLCMSFLSSLPSIVQMPSVVLIVSCWLGPSLTM